MLLMVSMVSAFGTPQLKYNDVIDAVKNQIKTQDQTENLTQMQIQIRENVQAQVKDFTGLANARLRVNNTNAIIHIEQNIEKIQAKEKLRLEKIENLEIVELEGEIVAVGEEQVKFLGMFNVKRQVSYHISDEGQLNRSQRSFDFMYKFEK